MVSYNDYGCVYVGKELVKESQSVMLHLISGMVLRARPTNWSQFSTFIAFFKFLPIVLPVLYVYIESTIE